jgi:hypothetical protein
MYNIIAMCFEMMIAYHTYKKIKGVLAEAT